MLQWAREEGCLWNHLTCTNAASCGHLHVLQWARENGCEWREWTCASAARGGHLHARLNGCPWDEQVCELQWLRANCCPWNLEDVRRAAEHNGHLHVVEWARAIGCP